MTNHTDLLRRALDVIEDLEGWVQLKTDLRTALDNNAVPIETGGWRAIEEAKKDGTEYLLGNYGHEYPSVGYWESKPNYWGETGWYDLEDRQNMWYSSHPFKPDCFMPLPAPPVAESNHGGE